MSPCSSVKSRSTASARVPGTPRCWSASRISWCGMLSKANSMSRKSKTHGCFFCTDVIYPALA
eukprot:7831909-Pyramimonas_sp.AAC.1